MCTKDGGFIALVVDEKYHDGIKLTTDNANCVQNRGEGTPHNTSSYPVLEGEFGEVRWISTNSSIRASHLKNNIVGISLR